MAHLATELLRTTARAFYPTEHVLIIEALINHSTLSHTDLAHLLGMQQKPLRKLCGRLREDGLVSVQTRAERRADGSGSSVFITNTGSQQVKDRITQREWYYLNFHHAIDSIKYRLYKLNKHIESLGAPTTEKKDLSCPQCGNQYTVLEVMDKSDATTGIFSCRRCGHVLDPVEADERESENESMKRFNDQLGKILRLMEQIDATTVPENTFQEALAKQKPILRDHADPSQKMETVDLPGKNLQSSKGLEIKPEKIAVQVQSDDDVRREAQAEEERSRKEQEARQNALPDWISRSTVSGDITAVGAKEERMRRERETQAANLIKEEEQTGEKKPVPDGMGGEEDVMASYWEELEKAREQEQAQAREEDEDDEDDDEEDIFEDVEVEVTTRSTLLTSATNGATVNGKIGNGEVTHDEREAKRRKTDEGSAGLASSSQQPNGLSKPSGVKEAEDTPAASDEDEDELEFENI